MLHLQSQAVYTMYKFATLESSLQNFGFMLSNCYLEYHIYSKHNLSYVLWDRILSSYPLMEFIGPTGS